MNSVQYICETFQFQHQYICTRTLVIQWLLADDVLRSFQAAEQMPWALGIEGLLMTHFTPYVPSNEGRTHFRSQPSMQL